MGQYMLKGYRMLDAMCPVCSAVLLQTPISEGGMKYCVGCMEVDIGKSAFQVHFKFVLLASRLRVTLLSPQMIFNATFYVPPV